MDMAQTLMFEAAINNNSTNFKETPAIEDGHIGAYHDHCENRPVPADSVIEVSPHCLSLHKFKFKERNSEILRSSRCHIDDIQ
ncbi:hypothetical protein CsSME_00042800 [Camellia sinensis var. sinensis]